MIFCYLLKDNYKFAKSNLQRDNEVGGSLELHQPVIAHNALRLCA
jgi:hypothetical protein